jgi:uncharacterized protein YabN with tetrapyrrole methylase and pyrophosphatase domain
MTCFCCQGHKVVTEMTDGITSHTVCDDCREMVNTFFHVYGNLMTAVLEVAQAKRGSRG